MIKLYGTPRSHYYAMVKAFMMEKGFEFEEISIAPSNEDSFLAMSPAGKIPFIELREGFLSETTAILGFLENCIPEVPMLQEEHYHRAKMAQLIKVLELYVENPIARLARKLASGSALNPEVVAEAEATVLRGIGAVNRLALFNPWIHGAEMTIADFFAYYSFAVASPVSRAVWKWDILDRIENVRPWLKLMSARPFINTVDREREAAIAQ